MYYAISYAYGGRVVNNGNQADQLRRFASRQERDAWVAKGNAYVDAPDYREALPARDPRVRRAVGPDPDSMESMIAFGE